MGANGDDYVAGIEAVRDGNLFVAPPLSLQEVDVYRSRLSPQRDKNLALTPREVETLKLLLEGLKSREIAQRLIVSPRTIEVHRTNIMRKLGAKSLVDLTKIALERGY